MYRPEHKRQARFTICLYAWGGGGGAAGSHLRAVPGRLSVSCFGFPAGNSYFWGKFIVKPKPTGEPPPLGLELVPGLEWYHLLVLHIFPQSRVLREPHWATEIGLIGLRAPRGSQKRGGGA